MKTRMMILLLLTSAVVVFSANPPQKRVLAVGMSKGWQHESVSDALVTVYELGKLTGLWETVIRTDVELITKKKLERNARNLEDFDAIFFMTTGELPLDEQQKSDFLSFIRDDGKGFLGAHNATDTFYQWPEYGEMIGGYFDGHPWNTGPAAVQVVDRDFPAMRHFPPSFEIVDEIYQTKGFKPDSVRLLMQLDTSRADMSRPGVKYEKVPLAWAREYGKGRVFYCGLGHPQEVWSRPDIRKMWAEAIQWVLRIED